MSDLLQRSESVGDFLRVLKRNNTTIREDRADQISEDTELIYRRLIEDIDRDIKSLNRRRVQMMDISPIVTDSLQPALDFNPDKFVEADMQIGLQLREKTIHREIAIERYNSLFGRNYEQI